MLNISHNIYNNECSLLVTVLPVAMNHDVTNTTCDHAMIVRSRHYSTSRCQEIVASKDRARHRREQGGMTTAPHRPNP